MSETDTLNLITNLEEFIRTPVIFYHNYKKGLVILFFYSRREIGISRPKWKAQF